MTFVFKGEQDGVKRYEVKTTGLADFISGIKTIRNLLEVATRNKKELEIRFRKPS
jgi:hypothetical protein